MSEQPAPYDREVPDNGHIWEELEGLLSQVRGFQQRAAARQEKLLAAAAEMDEVQSKCGRMLTELATIGGQVARAT